MKNRFIFVLGFTGFLMACATTHPGNQGQSLNKDSRLPFKISAQTIEESQEESFQLIEVTLENTSENWLKVNRSQIVIDNPAESKLSVVLGKDLKDWAQAMSLRLQKDEHNKQLLRLGLTAAGAVAMGVGSKNDDSALVAAGALTVVGTYAWAVTDVIRQSYQAAEQSEKVPENHIYQPFSVPGKMFLRRWVLLNKPYKSVVNNLVLELETVQGEKDTYEIKL